MNPAVNILFAGFDLLSSLQKYIRCHKSFPLYSISMILYSISTSTVHVTLLMLFSLVVVWFVEKTGDLLLTKGSVVQK